MKVEVVLEDMGVGENGAKTQVVWKYSFTHPKTKLQKKNIYELEDHVEEEALSLDLPPNPNPKLVKNNSSNRFS